MRLLREKLSLGEIGIAHIEVLVATLAREKMLRIMRLGPMMVVMYRGI